MLCLVVLGLFAAANSLPTIYQFNAWKLAHGKVYSPDEEMKRMQIFMDNVKFIEEYNAREDTSMTLGLNDYADLTHEEFKAMMTGSVNQTAELKAWLEKEASTFIPPANFEEPSSIDWRTKGAVTPVKNQGQCGSCYSFAATGSLEGQWFRKTNRLVSLSEQQILDCSSAYGNEGCNGGYKSKSYQYIKDAGGIDTERGYPYEAVQRTCRFNTASIGAKVTGYSWVPVSESKLKTAVASIGPISVSIDASHRSFQFYKGGIYYEPACSSTRHNHAVLAVGYGSSGSQDYWLVKNSWGTNWGYSGYIYMLRNHNDHCAIASSSYYPLV